MNAQLQIQTKVPLIPKHSLASKQTQILQRKSICGGPPGVDGECAECRAKRLNIQRNAVSAPLSPHAVPPIVHEVLASPGQPLDAGTRAFMEPRFGHDFGQVRVHTDAKAAESARSVSALAYTVGTDMVFGAGQYRPRTIEGRRLLAHELTHTIQQYTRMQRFQTPLEMTGTEDRAEKEAQATANFVMLEQPIIPISGEATKVARQQSAPTPPNVFIHNTELGGLTVGNFDFHFRNCGILVWVWVKFQFTKDITSAEQTDYKKFFFNAIHGKWAHSGYSLKGKGHCPCGVIPIEIHAEENSKLFYHKLVDVEKKRDFKETPAPPGTGTRRPKVISDMNVNFYTDAETIAHEFGHVLGLYDEYDGGFFENIMFWHKNPPGGDPGALMASGTELRPRYFEQYRREVQKTAPKDCEYSISSSVPPVP